MVELGKESKDRLIRVIQAIVGTVYIALAIRESVKRISSKPKKKKRG